MPILNGPSLVPKTGAPDSLVILLHGRGSDGRDLIALGDLWAAALPKTAFYAPNAPNRYGIGYGYVWYMRDENKSAAERLAEPAAILNAFIDELLAEYKLDAKRCIVTGFSQGAIMSMHIAPRREVALGGVIAFSGGIPTGETLKAELKSKTPVCIIHGADDDVLPAAGSQNAAKLFTELGVPHELHVLPGLRHSIDHRAVQIATEFMERTFAIRPPVS